MLDPRIAVEVPVGLHRLHFLPERGHLATRHQRVGISVADEDTRCDRLVGGQGGFEQPMEADDCCEVLPVARHFQHRHPAEAKADGEMREVGFQLAQEVERGAQPLAHGYRIAA